MIKLYFLRSGLVLSLLLWSIAAFSQDIEWEKSYGGKHADYLFDALPTADYGFILAGSSLSRKTGSKTDDNNGDLDYWLWKMDAFIIDYYKLITKLRICIKSPTSLSWLSS